MVQPLRLMRTANRLVNQNLRIDPHWSTKKAAVVGRPFAVLTVELVAHYGLFADRGTRLARGSDGVERDETFVRLFSQDMLAVEPSHLRVFRILLELGFASPQ